MAILLGEEEALQYNKNKRLLKRWSEKETKRSRCCCAAMKVVFMYLGDDENKGLSGGNGMTGKESKRTLSGRL